MNVPTLRMSIVIIWVSFGWVLVAQCAESTSDNFQDVLALAGIDREALSVLPSNSDFTIDDWQILARLVYRLQQFPPNRLEHWATVDDRSTREDSTDAHLGQLLAITATVESIEQIDPPEGISSESVLPKLYRCRFRMANGSEQGAVLVPAIPKAWKNREISQEPVGFFGVRIGAASSNSDELGLLLTNHLAWYPRKNVSTGKLLLAHRGMDVSLLDEVKQRQPFVKPEISREGEAFYETLAALAAVDRKELDGLAKQNVQATAERWREKGPALRQRESELRQELTAAQDPTERKTLEQKVKATRRALAIAALIEKQAEWNVSCVAPLFLYPNEQVGELVRIEGMARRAVRIEITDGTLLPPSIDRTGLDAYYELEVFTSDSQNLPVVCCIPELPTGFPVGDKISEQVRVNGVFFKSWRYRTRKNLAAPGETEQQQRMYTPVVIGGVPTWLRATTTSQSPWGMWGGIAFLVLLIVFWFTMFSLAERDRRRRAAMQPNQLEDFPTEQ